MMENRFTLNFANHCVELGLRKIPFERQKEIPVEYKGVKLDCGYRIDVLVAHSLILELKVCESLQPIHEAQLLNLSKIDWLKGRLVNKLQRACLKGRNKTVSQLA